MLIGRARLSLLFVLITFGAMGLYAQDVVVSSADPPAAAQGTVNLNVSIKGKGFKRGAQALFVLTGTANPDGIHVNNTAFQGPGELIANIDVADSTTISSFDVIVILADGRTGKGIELFSVTPALFAGGKPSNPNNATSVIYDYDPNNTILLMRSDDFNDVAQASYSPADNLTSEIGTLWQIYLGRQSQRRVYLTLSQAVAGSPAPPAPDGYYYEDVQVYSQCYDINNQQVSLAAIVPGTSQNRCSLGVNFSYNRTKYKLAMSPTRPGTGWAVVGCTAADSMGACNAWSIAPNLTAEGGNVPTVANLYRFPTHGDLVFLGSYYNTYRIRVTKP